MAWHSSASWKEPFGTLMCGWKNNAGSNRISYTTLKICCDQTNSNITTQFLTEHLLTLQDFFKCSIWLPLVVRQTSRQYSNSSHSLSKKVTRIRAMALIRISYGCLPHNQWQPYRTLAKKFEVLTCVPLECVLWYYYSFGHNKFSKLYTLFYYTLYYDGPL
jgi:hypothetical protein